MLDKVAFGERVATARNDRKMTQDGLGELCDISGYHLRQIENGKKGPSIALLITLCNELQVSPAYLLQDSLKSTYPDNYDLLKQELLNAPPTRAEFAVSMIELIKKLLV